jgi:hypothetical protein
MRYLSQKIKERGRRHLGFFCVEKINSLMFSCTNVFTMRGFNDAYLVWSYFSL